MVMKFKFRTLFILCTLVVFIIGIGVIFGVLEFKEFQKSENILIAEDLTDCLMICYFCGSESVLIMSPIVSYYDEGSSSEVVLTFEKMYFMRNWDYKIFYSRTNFFEENKKFDKEPNKKF